MNSPELDKVFAGGSMPEVYDAHLVPLIFQPYADDLAKRMSALAPKSILEIAAGTGVVTRAMATALPESTSIVATDLSQPMLNRAMAMGTSRNVEWRQADAMQLPFGEAQFDAVVCQFGVMFFPDKAKAISEMRRVLKPGGVCVFNVWDRLEENEFADETTKAMATMFPQNPPKFLARTPYGYYDRSVIQKDVTNGGFTGSPRIETIPARSTATSARIPALAYCQGTPLRNEIEAQDSSTLERATNIAAEAITRRSGNGPVDTKIQAHVVTLTT